MNNFNKENGKADIKWPRAVKSWNQKTGKIFQGNTVKSNIKKLVQHFSCNLPSHPNKFFSFFSIYLNAHQLAQNVTNQKRPTYRFCSWLLLPKFFLFRAFAFSCQKFTEFSISRSVFVVIFSVGVSYNFCFENAKFLADILIMK